MEIVVSQVINGLMLSCTYALIGVGFSLFFGALNVIHFAHGDVCVAGAFLTLLVHKILIGSGLTAVWPHWLTIVVTLFTGIGLAGLFGLLVERVAIRPFREAPLLIVLVATVALGIVIRESIRNFFPTGANPQSFPQMLPDLILFESGMVQITAENLIILLATVLLIGGLFLLIKTTRLGLAIRAVCQDANTAMMMGISRDRTVIWTFLIGSALGAVAGLINGVYFGGIRFDLGLNFGVKGFSVAVVGGLGNVSGAVIGGLLFGMMETFAMGFIPQGTAWKDLIAFSVVILFLILRPTGIMGQKEFEKV